MYRSVIESGWVAVYPLTVMVGKNESGKSALLQALVRLNPPDEKQTYDMSTDWPRNSRRSANPEQVVCSARFRLTDDELSALEKIARKGTRVPKTVEIWRDYAGSYYTDLSETQFPDVPDNASISEEWASIKVPETLGEAFRAAVEQALEKLRRIPPSNWATDLSDELKVHEANLRSAVSTPAIAAETVFLSQFSASARRVLDALSELPTPMSVAEVFVQEQLPTFIYMDDYPAFTGTAQLDEVKGRLALTTPKTTADQTFLMILELAGLDLDALLKKATTNVMERQFDLDEAGTALTEKVKGRWSQGDVEVAFRADANKFMTFVRVPERNENKLIRLEERSRGFQWFFSFDLMFMHESGGTYKDCVLLLDEPGLHLHPGGQKDLVRRLEAYSGANTVIYTTHLPYMLNLREPQRIRVVSETAEGTVVDENLNSSQPAARLLLEAAFGITLSHSHLVAARNLVVEGVTDFWIVTELSNLMARTKRKSAKSIPEDVLITPAGGASEAAYMATFMAGQQLGVVVLLDSDSAGRAAAYQLIENWLNRYDGTRIEVVDLAEALGVPGTKVTLEDLFLPDAYLQYAKGTHAKEIASTGSELPDLGGHGSLASQVDAAFKAIGAKYHKGRVAKAIRIDLLARPSIDSLEPETQDKALKLIAALNKSIAKLKKPADA